MGKRYFAPRRRQGPGVYTIFFSLCGLLLAGWAVLYVSGFFSGGSGGQEVEAGALTSLEEARALLKSGQVPQAEALLKELAERGDQVVAPQAIVLQAQLLEESGQDDQAMALLQRVNDQYPASAEGPAASARYARLLEKQGKFEEALAIFEDIGRSAPPPLRTEGLLGMARKAEREKRLLEARALYERGLNDAQFNTPAWEEAAKGVGAINTATIFSTLEAPESKLYSVESGDTLTSIGIKLNTTLGLLTRANGLTEDAVLKPGQKLKYTPKDFRIVIERSTCRLFLLDKSGLFKMYSVGLGMEGYETALGKYTIGNKQKDPTWFKPGAAPVPAGDPANELGSRWMPLVPVEQGLPSDLGIHGTIAPESIGLFQSHGCPRMHNAEVEELYDLVVRSTPVEIVERLERSPASGTSEAILTASSA